MFCQMVFLFFFLVILKVLCGFSYLSIRTSMTCQDVIRDLDRSLRPPRSTGHGSSDQNLDDISRPDTRPRSTCPQRPPVMPRPIRTSIDQILRSQWRWRPDIEISMTHEDLILRPWWHIKTWYWCLERTVRGVHQVWIVRSGSGWAINTSC